MLLGIKKRKNILITVAILAGLAVAYLAHYEYNLWYNPARNEFNLVFGNFLKTRPKQICNESLGGMTDVSPRTFYHVYYYAVGADEITIMDAAKSQGYNLNEDYHAEQQRVPGYNDNEKYFSASSNGKKIEVNIASGKDQVTLYCGSLGNYQNYGKTISPGPAQDIIEFRVTTS